MISSDHDYCLSNHYISQEVARSLSIKESVLAIKCRMINWRLLDFFPN